MSAYWAFAVIVVAIIAGCNAPTIANALQPKSAAQVCVEKAWTQADRIQCLQNERQLSKEGR